ncbi:hypothetical protein D3C72_816760 [compost metagenome]
MLIRHRLGRVGAGNPQRLDLAVAHLLEQFDGTETGTFRQPINAPICRYFGAMFRVGRVSMARQQIRQTARFAPAHGIRLTGEGERSCTRTADLPGG